MTVLEKIQTYLDARAIYDEAHATSQAAHKMMRDAEYELVDTMLSDGVPSMGLDSGVNVSLRKQYSCSVTTANEAQIREWLVETRGDDSDFVHEKVNKPALIEWMKEQQKEPDDVPAFLKLNTRPGITVRGWKTRT
jgi:hypothetical protein